jgi:hypothetical protein
MRCGLLRGYAATGREDFRDALEAGLGSALDISAESSSETAPPWLILFGEAAEASDDARVRAAASALAAKARMIWGASTSLALAARSVDACLRARLELQGAVDELERLIAASYEPGHGVGTSVEGEMATAGALLTAFLVTGRLPYAMLAEELAKLRDARIWAVRICRSTHPATPRASCRAWPRCTTTTTIARRR